MASPKNSARRKRKYDTRKGRTEANKKRRARRHEKRTARLVARTRDLMGKHVTVRLKDQDRPHVGTVIEVLSKDHDEYPRDAQRHSGSYLRVQTNIGDYVVSRHRAKVTRD